MAKLVRWTPTHNLNQTLRTFDQMLDGFYRTNEDMQQAKSVLRPAMDIIETEENYTLRVDLPGLSPEDVNVEIEDSVLTISGEVNSSEEVEGERYHYRERRYGAFERSVRLGDQLDVSNVDATFDNGVLTIVLPKLPEAQPQRIKVQMAHA